MRTNMIVLTILLGCLAAGGCRSSEAIVKDRYLVQVHRGGDGVTNSDAVGTVMPFSIAPAFGTNGFVYRVGESKYETDYYNEYFVAPAQMVTEQVQRWLTASGIVRVVPVTSLVEAQYVLEGDIRKFYADYLDKDSPRAVLEIFFVVVDQTQDGSRIEFSKTYLASVRMKGTTSESYIDAMSQALRQVLESLEQDLTPQ